MYEARQNKEKVSRRIDGGGGIARQRIRIGKNIVLHKHIFCKKILQQIAPITNKTLQMVQVFGIEATKANEHLFTEYLKDHYKNAIKGDTTYYYLENGTPTITFRYIISGIQVSAHVHYQNGTHNKVRGNAWIQNVNDFDFPTPQEIVDDAPDWNRVSGQFNNLRGQRGGGQRGGGQRGGRQRGGGQRGGRQRGGRQRGGRQRGGRQRGGRR